MGEDVRGSTQKRRFVLCTNLVVRTPKGGREISQKQGLEQNLSSTDVHELTSVERYTEYILWRTGSFALGCLLGAIFSFFVEDNPCFKFYKRTRIICILLRIVFCGVVITGKATPTLTHK